MEEGREEEEEERGKNGTFLSRGRPINKNSYYLNSVSSVFSSFNPYYLTNPCEIGAFLIPILLDRGK